MKASVRWINRYLEPGNLGAADVEELLTQAGFPIDAREDLPGGDARLEVEVTSNRGDCLSHLGLAREIAARTGRSLKAPAPAEAATGGDAAAFLKLENQAGDACPRFTVHVIRGITVGPSPAWLAEALESVGQRSINNVVDTTNFINFEFGNPCHVFDLDKLAGHSLIVRYARDGEPLTTLDGKARKLKADEVVVADAQRAQSLAGVIGGGDSEVSVSTRNVVLEMATWDPVAVRRAARRHQLKTDAGHRFERYVDARTLDLPARRAATLIAHLGGGTLAAGMLDTAPTLPSLRQLELRLQRIAALLGIEVGDDEIARLLGGLGIHVSMNASSPSASPAPSPRKLVCTIPAWRPDLEREVDLVEEVGRLKGLDAIPMHDRVNIRVKGPQPGEQAIREIGGILTGLGFDEAVTFSFVPPADAGPFLPPDRTLLTVDDDRRKADGALRPSILPSLLACRRQNQDAGVEVPGGIRLYETAAVFAQRPDKSSDERRVLALLMDVPGVGKGKPGSVDERQRGIRILRGALESVVHALAGQKAALELEPGAAPFKAFDPAACASIHVGGHNIGWLGLIAPGIQQRYDLGIPVVAAELDLPPLVDLYPPRARVVPLPAFPGIQRDLSLLVDEAVSWKQVRELAEGAGLDRLDGVAFVGTYRGKQVGAGRKSLTLRLRFRDPARTLRHEEVDPQVASIVALAAARLGAELRK